VYAIFSARARGEAAAQPLAVLTEELRAALSHVDLDTTADRYRWAWRHDRDAVLQRPLWAVAKSAADLLTSGRALAVRQCAAETCWWLFLDTSRNQSRRWCDMKVCGNREKVRRFYERAARVR
jgi:predicted RNA-binding Zn ribbon-like protein